VLLGQARDLGASALYKSVPFLALTVI